MNYFDENKISYKNYIGNGGPMRMNSEGVEINEITIQRGVHDLPIDRNKIHSYY